MADDGFTPDWDALTEEATELLSAYTRVDTQEESAHRRDRAGRRGRGSMGPAGRGVRAWPSETSRGLLCVQVCCGEERRIVDVQRSDDTQVATRKLQPAEGSAERSERLMKHDAFP